LEDDCLPHPDLFRFCDSLLARYRNDPRVWIITSDNFRRGDASYYSSKYNHCWGWASWRRPWKHYDGDIAFWPEWRRSASWRERIPDKVERRYWERILDRVRNGKINSWAYPWTTCVWSRG